ncbi:phosphatase PAP2 family protein [Cohnella sp. CFH 77786]|uniref:undecaprenyl-diphosphatase n=1 Tax=Cohnella sp. CFH 77786 TaxID=2662265 RepID=UPI001C60CF43|nr:undecaprenyl-diphosphatase [Cohnella sp. CFH 77786]MBW5449220.1 phosphatase PAP2 family protein [Cohnella sp. CFH 77786]
MQSIDYPLFQAINGMAGHFALMDAIMKFLSMDGEYVFFLGITMYWFTRTEFNRRMVVEALVAACAALGASSVLGSLFYRNRPFVDHHVHLLIQHAANASFPSDHAAASFAVATAIWNSHRKEGRAWLALAAGITVSRVWTGVHYPLDVLSGFILGTGTAVAIHACHANSEPIQRVFIQIIRLYERIEGSVWPRRYKGEP